MPLTTTRPRAVTAPAIRWLGSPETTDRTISGALAARLSALASSVCVPAGFVVSAPALRELAPGEPLPDALRAEISTAYRRLVTSGDLHAPEVAVRASLVADGGVAPAGYNHVSLNVIGAADVIAAVERCRDAAGEGRRIAVLVQQMVHADVSAVVLSANPLTGAENESIVIAARGLGMSLSDGTVTPDTWVIDRASGLAIEQHIGAKLRMTVPDIEGVREVDTPAGMRYLPSLASRQVRELAELAARLERRMGWPVDIECAFRGDTLYLLRCRPQALMATARLAA